MKRLKLVTNLETKMTFTLICLQQINYDNRSDWIRNETKANSDRWFWDYYYTEQVTSNSSLQSSRPKVEILSHVARFLLITFVGTKRLHTKRTMLHFFVRNERHLQSRYSNIYQYWPSNRFLCSQSHHGVVRNKFRLSDKGFSTVLPIYSL